MRKSASSWRIYAVCAMKFEKLPYLFLLFSFTKGKMGVVADVCEERIKQMINYEEELAKFQPSLEIDEAEEAILHNDMTDISDIIELIVKSGNK